MAKNPHPSLPSSLQVQVEMLSDWHIGSGAGTSGKIDSMVKRDHHDLPYIPAKTLTGIWRDACELLAQGLDNNQAEGKWQKWVNYIFGDQPSERERSPELSINRPRPAILSVRSEPERSPELSINRPRPAILSVRAAHFPQSLAETLNGKDKKISQQLKQAITFIKPGIKIDGESGCAEKDCLRLEEQVRMGVILTADCTLTLPEQEEQQQTVCALLIAGAAMVERLGGNRRRGGGRCRITVSHKSDGLQKSVAWLQAHPHPPNIPPWKSPGSKRLEISNHEASQAWVSVPLQINLRSPLIISRRTVGNVVETLDYIPGTHLLRLVARKLGKLGVDIQDFIVNGDLLVTNATLEIEGEGSKPVPLALFYEKLGDGFQKGGRIYNRLLEAEPEGEQLKGYREGYIRASSPFAYQTVPLTLGTHNTIADRYQRPTREVGGVYSYEAIKTGTILRAELRSRQYVADILERHNPKWREKLAGKDSLGQSKKDDYGNVEIFVLDSPPALKPQQNITPSDKLYVWLLSDLLLRDERLRPTASAAALAKELSKKLGVEIEVTEEKEETLNFIARQNRLDSWQVNWGLPRPSLVGLKAGTCVVFDITGESPNPDILTEIEAQGIGERTAEGYGQLCFNHPLLTQKFADRKSKKSSQNSPPNGSDSQNRTIKTNDIVWDYAHLIETVAWREEMQRKAVAIASKPQKRQEILGITLENGESKPPMSQMGALRSIISWLQCREDSEKVTGWLENLRQVKSRREKWNQGSLDNIKDLVSNSELIWQKLEITPNLTMTEDAESKLKDELWTEAIRTLIDACIVAHKRDLEKINSSEVENG